MLYSKMRRVCFSAASISALVLFATPLAATTWHVPSHCPTIQAGIDSAATGDTVLVACGMYYERGIDLKPGITLRGATGNADCVIIDGEGVGPVIRGWNIFEPTLVEALTVANGDYNMGGGMSLAVASVLVRSCVIRDCVGGHGGGVCLHGVPSPSIEDCTFLNNSATYYGGGVKLSGGVDANVLRCRFEGNSAGSYGGGIGIATETSLVQECIFIDNSAARYGGGIWVSSQCDIVDCELFGNTAESGGGVAVIQSSPTLSGCILYDNTTAGEGGGLYFYSAAPTLIQCTILFNAGGAGAGGIFTGYESFPSIDRTIIAFSTLGAAISTFEPLGIGQPELSCCDVYGNAGGDWVGAIAHQAGIDGNFSDDPFFCNRAEYDFTLAGNSPCLPGNHPTGWDCGLIGALGQGCGPVALTPKTWARVKARYR